MLLVYFIPYIYLFICFLVVRVKEPSPAKALLAEPARGGRDRRRGPGAHAVRHGRSRRCRRAERPIRWLFRSRSSAGAGLFVVLGGLIYWRGRR